MTALPLPSLTPEERARFRGEGVMPSGWQWCPLCNGEGEVATMAANPDLTETVRPCGQCEAEQGIVPRAEIRTLASFALPEDQPIRPAFGAHGELEDL